MSTTDTGRADFCRSEVSLRRTEAPSEVFAVSIATLTRNAPIVAVGALSCAFSLECCGLAQRHLFAGREKRCGLETIPPPGPGQRPIWAIALFGTT
jgi:hypothetical protein